MENSETQNNEENEKSVSKMEDHWQLEVVEVFLKRFKLVL
jgi:hypothetical protein